MADKKSPKDTRFKPGQSGNPKGRRKRDTLIDDFYEELFHTVDGPMERRYAILKRLFTSAMDAKRKDHAKILELAVVVYFGKPKERVEMSGPGGGPIPSADLTPRRRPTTGELRKRMEALFAKREAHLAAKKTRQDQAPADPTEPPEEPEEPES